MNEMIEAQSSSASTVQAEPNYTWPFGAKHQRSRRIVGAVLVVILMSPILWLCFAAEITAAMWHVRHGNTFDFEGVRFTIPSDRYVRCWYGNACGVISGVGYLRYRLTKRPGAWIMLNATTSNSTDKIRQREQMRANAMHWTLLEERHVNMGGIEMECSDYLQPNKRFHSVLCSGSGTPIFITFMGSADPASFYNLLSTAQKR